MEKGLNNRDHIYISILHIKHKMYNVPELAGDLWGCFEVSGDTDETPALSELKTEVSVVGIAFVVFVVFVVDVVVVAVSVFVVEPDDRNVKVEVYKQHEQ